MTMDAGNSSSNLGRAKPVREYAFHPISEIFPLMEGEDFEKLKSDIASNGQREPVWLYEGKILDGRNRYLACKQLNREVETRLYEGSDPRGFVISMNIHRRHLTAEQKRGLIAELLRAAPQASDRKIAAQANVSHRTVADVRQATGQSVQLPAREGRDGKLRKISNRIKRESSPKQLNKQLEAFKVRWESFNSWQKRTFIKSFKDEISELLEEVELEDSVDKVAESSVS